jgi:cysteinyl-tRNA synthetase
VVRSDLPATTRRATVDRFDVVLGLRLADWKEDLPAIPADIALLFDEREMARAAKDWNEADRLREQLRAEGWIVEDGRSGQVLRPRDTGT